MANYLIWNDNDIIWNNNDYLWNNVYEIVAEVASETQRTVFVDVRKYRHQLEKLKKNKPPIKWKKEEKKYVKLLCIIDDEEFEEIKYINKRLKVESFDEELIIREIKQINVSTDEINLTDIQKTKKENLIGEVDNIKIVKKTPIKKVKISVDNVKIT